MTCWLYYSVRRLYSVRCACKSCCLWFCNPSVSSVNSWKRWTAVKQPETSAVWCFPEVAANHVSFVRKQKQTKKHLKCSERQSDRISEAASAAAWCQAFKDKTEETWTQITSNAFWISFLFWPDFINPGSRNTFRLFLTVSCKSSIHIYSSSQEQLYKVGEGQARCGHLQHRDDFRFIYQQKRIFVKIYWFFMFFLITHSPNTGVGQ